MKKNLIITITIAVIIIAIPVVLLVLDQTAFTKSDNSSDKVLQADKEAMKREQEQQKQDKLEAERIYNEIISMEPNNYNEEEMAEYNQLIKTIEASKDNKEELNIIKNSLTALETKVTKRIEKEELLNSGKIVSGSLRFNDKDDYVFRLDFETSPITTTITQIDPTTLKPNEPDKAIIKASFNIITLKVTNETTGKKINRYQDLKFTLQPVYEVSNDIYTVLNGSNIFELFKSPLKNTTDIGNSKNYEDDPTRVVYKDLTFRKDFWIPSQMEVDETQDISRDAATQQWTVNSSEAEKIAELIQNPAGWILTSGESRSFMGNFSDFQTDTTIYGTTRSEYAMRYSNSISYIIYFSTLKK